MSRLHFFFFPSSLHFFKLPEGLPRICNQQQCVSQFENQLFTLPSHTHTHTHTHTQSHPFFFLHRFIYISLSYAAACLHLFLLTYLLPLFPPSLSLTYIYTSLFTHHCVPSLIPPFENHLIRKACEAHMSPPLPPPPHTPPVIPLFFRHQTLLSFFSCILLVFFNLVSLRALPN